MSITTIRKPIQVTVTLAALGYLVWALKTSLLNIRQTQIQLDPLLLISFLLMLVAHIVPCLIWWRMTIRLGFALPFRDTASIYYISWIYKYIPGNVWVAASRFYYYIDKGFDRRAVAFGVTLEPILGLMASIAAFLVTFPFVKDSMNVQRFLWVLFVFTLMLSFTTYPRFLNLLLAVYARLTGKQEVKQIQVPYFTLLSTMALHIFLVWPLFSAANLVLIKAIFSDDVSKPSFWMVLNAFSGAACVGVLGLTPGGIGTSEAMLILMLASVMGYENAALMAVASRFVRVVCEFFLSGIVLTYAYFFETSKKAE